MLNLSGLSAHEACMHSTDVSQTRLHSGGILLGSITAASPSQAWTGPADGSAEIDALQATLPPALALGVQGAVPVPPAAWCTVAPSALWSSTMTAEMAWLPMSLSSSCIIMKQHHQRWIVCRDEGSAHGNDMTSWQFHSRLQATFHRADDSFDRTSSLQAWLALRSRSPRASRAAWKSRLTCAFSALMRLFSPTSSSVRRLSASSFSSRAATLLSAAVLASRSALSNASQRSVTSFLVSADAPAPILKAVYLGLLCAKLLIQVSCTLLGSCPGLPLCTD